MTHFDCTVDNCLLLVIDVQERFVGAIPSIAPGGTTAHAIRLIMDGCKLLGLPLLVTQQYPKGLGASLPYVQEAQAAAGASLGDKTHFSVIDDEALRLKLADYERDTIIVAGIEAHVCVLATVADLKQRGYNVVVAADAIASRNLEHASYAKQAMAQLGALVLPCESILFRLQRQAGVGEFKALRDLVK